MTIFITTDLFNEICINQRSDLIQWLMDNGIKVKAREDKTNSTQFLLDFPDEPSAALFKLHWL